MKEYKLLNVNPKTVQIRRKVIGNNMRYGKILFYTDADVDG